MEHNNSNNTIFFFTFPKNINLVSTVFVCKRLLLILRYNIWISAESEDSKRERKGNMKDAAASWDHA